MERGATCRTENQGLQQQIMFTEAVVGLAKERNERGEEREKSRECTAGRNPERGKAT